MLTILSGQPQDSPELKLPGRPVAGILPAQMKQISLPTTDFFFIAPLT